MLLGGSCSELTATHPQTAFLDNAKSTLASEARDTLLLVEVQDTQFVAPSDIGEPLTEKEELVPSNEPTLSVKSPSNAYTCPGPSCKNILGGVFSTCD